MPVLDGTMPGLQAARHLLAYRDFLARPADPPPAHPARAAIWRPRLRGRQGALDEAEACALLADFGIPTLPSTIVESAEAAVAAARAHRLSRRLQDGHAGHPAQDRASAA